MFALGACSLRVTTGHFGDDVSGSQVQQAIDYNIGAVLQSYDQRLTILPSLCASRLDVSKGKIAYCTLTVSGVSLPVRVVYSGPDPQGFKANLGGDFFEKSTIESFVEKQLHLSYGITAIAHCPGYPVQLIAPGAMFSCAVSGASRVRTVRLKEVAKAGCFNTTFRVCGSQRRSHHLTTLLLSTSGVSR